MSLEKHKAMQSVERLLKQGKVQAALAELQRVTQSAPNDLLTLNRLGDLLAAQGRHAEAIDHYRRIAERFAQGGFFPKAGAIHKKILRLNPKHIDSLAELGALYLQQRLVGEARAHFLQAAELCVKSHDFERARKIYETLVQAEPGEPRHRVRLAETLAAAGHTVQAGESLLDLAELLFTSGKPQESEAIFTRAGELLPTRSEPLLGLARALVEQGREEKAIALLERAVTTSPHVDARVLGELALRYALERRLPATFDLMQHASFLELPSAMLQQLFRIYRQQGALDAAWQRLEPVLDAAGAQRDLQPLVLFLEALAEVDEHGHIPALQRLYEVQRRAGDRAAAVRAVEWLVRAYQAGAMHDEASLMLDRLREIAPESPLVAVPVPAETSASTDWPATTPDAGDGGLQAGGRTDGGSGLGVPRSRADEEFISGRLTQAEILEKYGLRKQALDQLREVIERFPGHVGAVEKRVGLLRGGGAEPELAEALGALALALRAAGDPTSAQEPAREAGGLAGLSPGTRRALMEIGLLERASAARPVVDAATSVSASDDEIVIEFDGGTSGVEAPVMAAAPPQAAGSRARGVTRPPTDDMLEEIRFEIEEGALDAARRRVEALRVLGYSSAELDRLADAIARPAQATRTVPRPAPVRPEDERRHDVFGLVDDDELAALTATLEDELGSPALEPPPALPAKEESIGDIFAAFRQQVQQEVGDEDFRTHYDLGIAYKEMGLTDEAIREFELVSRSPALYREACSMIAICHRDRNDMTQAAHWYRAAIEAPDHDVAAETGLRYDLAEVLLATGDTEAALDLFRDVLRTDPAFREVGARVRDLEAQIPH